jgi:hypothetical protein
MEEQMANIMNTILWIALFALIVSGVYFMLKALGVL